jgi:hypothetical protein
MRSFLCQMRDGAETFSRKTLPDHDTRHTSTRHDDAQRNNSQNNDRLSITTLVILQNDTQHNDTALPQS